MVRDGAVAPPHHEGSGFHHTNGPHPEEPAAGGRLGGWAATGDTLYVLHYEGEGVWKIWFRGKTESVEQEFFDVREPKAEWWVKVKKRDGVVGWTLSKGHFLHQDACE